MTHYRWLRVTPTGRIPPREGRAVPIGDREIALFNLGPSTALGQGDQFLATDNQCPHKGGPLCDGIVTGTSVVCPLHAWKVDLVTGEVERPSHGKDHCVTTYPTRIEGDVVSIGLPVACEGTPEGASYVGHPFKGANPGTAA
jgi:nitrite reductase (NADH) small subunit